MIENPLSSSQERYIEEALEITQSQGFHIQKAIENCQLKICLKEASIMLAELKTSLLTPINYYKLFSSIFDQMQYVEQYFRDEFKRGRKISDLYESVQQAANIIPRLYLLITVGSIYIETKEVTSKQIMFDLLQIIKGVQNPVRGLFLRYYCLKLMKDKLPDEDSEYINESNNVEVSVEFILENFKEMNKLWLKISKNLEGNQKIFKERERNELRSLIGENIIRLASLNSLTLEMYQKDVLPKVLKIIIESKDTICQQYIMECIILAFPNDFNIICMPLILDACTKLNSNVDVKSLFINLMDKLAKLVSDSNFERDSKFKDSFNDENIFEMFRINIDKIINDQCLISDNYRLLELLVAFMKFSLKCNTSQNKVEFVNHILSSSVNIASKFTKINGRISKEGISLLTRILSSPLDSLSLAILEMNQYTLLMEYLDYSNRKTLALRILETLTNSNEHLNKFQKLNVLISYIRDLLFDSQDAQEIDENDLEYEMQRVSKIVYMVCDVDVENMLSILEKLVEVFKQGTLKRIKYTIPTIIGYYIITIQKLIMHMHFTLHKNPLDDTIKNHVEAFIGHNFNINKEIEFSSEEEYLTLVKRIYVEIEKSLNFIQNDFPEMAIKLCLQCVLNINKTSTLQNQLGTELKVFMEQMIKIMEDLNDQDLKFSLFIQIVGTLEFLVSNNTIFYNIYNEYINKIFQTVNKFTRRPDQCLSMLSLSNLYWNGNIKNELKVGEILIKAQKFAQYAMTNYQNLGLFVNILNKYIYFIDKGITNIQTNQINEIIDIVKNHIDTIKSENSNPVALCDIEKYFEFTLQALKIKKAKFYDEFKV